MNRGNIPGFYYDEDKKKYFKIQADHQAPSKDAKYTKSNVKREARESKRQKRNHEQQQVRRRQTVQRSKVLEHPLMMIGGTREYGVQQPATLQHQRDAFVIEQLQPGVLWPGDHPALHGIQIVDINFSMHTRKVLMAYTHGNTAHYASMYSERLPARGNNYIFPAVSGSHSRVEAFHSSIAATSLAWSPSHAAEGVLVCAQQTHAMGNVSLNYSGEGEHEHRVSLRFSLGRPTNSLWASKFREGADLAAIAGTEDIFIITHEANVTHRLPLVSESRDVAWLDHSVIVYGQHTPSNQAGPETSYHNHDHNHRFKHKSNPVTSSSNQDAKGLMLHDLRARDTALRFPLSAPLTGILAPSPLHLLASSNRRLSYYDTRMPKLPLFSFPHVHQGPQLQFTTNGNGRGNLVAALDQDNWVNIYSLQKGRQMGVLKPPEEQGGGQGVLMGKLRWFEDVDGQGPMIMACQGTRVVRWGFD